MSAKKLLTWEINGVIFGIEHEINTEVISFSVMIEGGFRYGC